MNFWQKLSRIYDDSATFVDTVVVNAKGITIKTKIRKMIIHRNLFFVKFVLLFC
jgi:hypothetical protein